MNIKKYIPDFVTSLNLVCGIVGVVFAFKARLDYAFYLMLSAAVFDFLDGFAARLLDSYSDFGKEMDSLADLVSFGVLPAIMLFSLMRVCMFGENNLCWVPLVLAVFAALRLAKYNVSGFKESGFLGLPVPAAAMVCGSLCCFVCYSPASFLATWASGPVFIPVLSVCLALLMISNIPMFSIKFGRDDSYALKTKRLALLLIVVAALAICIIFQLHFSLVVLIAFVCYIVKNLIYAVFKI